MPAPTAVPPVTTSTFQRDVLDADVPVLVDVWSETCSVCRAMKPTVAALAEAYEGRLRVVTLDADHHPEMANRYEVRSLPTLLLFQDGDLVGRTTGYVAEPALRNLLDQVLVAD